MKCDPGTSTNIRLQPKFAFFVALALLASPALLAVPTFASNSASRTKRAKPAIATDQLVRCITPGITAKNLVDIKKPFRPLSQEFGQPVEPGYTGEAEFTDAAAERILVNGQSCIVLLATYKATEETTTVSGQVVVLALFRMQGQKPVLIDAVDVSGDRFCCFTDNPILHYKTGSDAVVVDNNHFNSSENFSALSIVALINNRLTELVRNVPVLYNARNAHASMVEESNFVVGAAKHVGGAKQRSAHSSIVSTAKPLSMSIKVTFSTYDDNDSDKVVSKTERTFVVPFKLQGSTYSIDSKDKQLTALNDFVKKNGFDAP